MSEKGIKYARSFKEQFTVRGMFWGIIGSAVITTSSMYVALKMGALPWPTIFVAVASMGILKLMGNTNINEINVTHTAMSAGAMVAGGVAFTIPGIYMLDKTAIVGNVQLLTVTIGGVVLGLIFTALIRKYFVVTQALPYPMGIAAAETLIAGDEGGKKALLLGSTMVVIAIFVTIRDWFKIIPQAVFNQTLLAKGIPFGVWLAPMAVAIGYIIGPLFTGVWFLGALIGFFGINMAGVSFGFFADLPSAEAFRQSLGIGVMVGTGIGILIKGILPKAKEIYGPMFKKGMAKDGIINFRWAPIVLVILAFVFTFILKMGIVASIITILGVWITTSMSAQIVGQTGINPMEIFGIIVLLVAKFATSIGQLEAFFVAGVVAVACGLTGDILNDFKSGYILKSDPKAQWLAQGIGGLVGAFVSVVVLLVMVKAYGTMGPNTPMPAPQAAAVAAMVGGIPDMTGFTIGLIMGAILYVVNVPVMTLGIGIYLPMFISLTVALGGLVRLIVNIAAPNFSKKDTGTIIAAGLLGGEGIAGVVIAIIMVIIGVQAK
ncbi:MAG: OPT/YSL family transporter [Eubacteriales bacterium]